MLASLGEPLVGPRVAEHDGTDEEHETLVCELLDEYSMGRIEVIAALRSALECLVELEITEARQRGVTLQRIADARGMSPAGVRKRYKLW